MNLYASANIVRINDSQSTAAIEGNVYGGVGLGAHAEGNSVLFSTLGTNINVGAPASPGDPPFPNSGSVIGAYSTDSGASGNVVNFAGSYSGSPAS